MKDPVTYDDLRAVTGAMASFPAPWYVSGGWAIDLYLDRVTRTHEDIEIGIERSRQTEIRGHFPQRALFKAVNQAWVPWEQEEMLELPVFQVLVGPEGAGEFEFFLNEVRNGRWHFRRDEAISGPEEELIVLSSSGIPILAPEIQLLYKSKGMRPKDERDLAAVLSCLEPHRRERLGELLSAHRPDHPWLTTILGSAHT